VGVVSRLTGGGAALWSPESRYVTNIPATAVTAFTTGAFPAFPGIPFRAFDLEAGATITRCEYGYIEFIGEERVAAPDAAWTFARLGTGVIRDVDNVLMGNVYIIRPEVAISHQYNMTGIANFAIDPAGIWRDPGTARPNLLTEVQGEVVLGIPNVGAGGFDNLEALLSKRWVDFQYVTGIDPADTTQTPMTTSLVVTFPTKHHHYSRAGTFPIIGLTTWPYGPPFTAATETAGEVVTVSIYDRTERLLVRPVDSISPSPTPGLSLIPFEVNILGLIPQENAAAQFRNNLMIATANVSTAQTFYNGWGEIDLSPALGLAGDLRTRRQGEYPLAPPPLFTFNFYNNFFDRYQGLPTIGLVMTEFYNDAVQGYYGNTVPWQYGVDWGNAIIPLAP
jgi:hypothetical protein